MIQFLSRRVVYLSLSLLSVAALAVIFAIPPEYKLGSAIRVVLLHGALARTGITLFVLAALVGAMALVRPRDILHRLGRTLQDVVLVEWIVYAVSSVIATWLTWGVPFAWQEPRTQASAKILVMAIVFCAISRWIGEQRFTAVANVFAGVVSFVLVRTAGLVQHPEDPVMTAGTSIYPILFVALWLILVVMALLAARLVYLSRYEPGHPR